ncbi:MAG: hypothetical protein WCR95_00800 [Eubacteriales bacterium]
MNNSAKNNIRPGRSENSGGIVLTHSALDKSYSPGEKLTFALGISNNSEAALKNFSLSTDLGRAQNPENQTGAPLAIFPPALLYLNGLFCRELDGCRKDGGYYFDIASLAADDKLLIVYKTRVTDFAPLEKGGKIAVTSSLRDSENNVLSQSQSLLTVEEYTDLLFYKTLCRREKENKTYVYDIRNRGNTSASGAFVCDMLPPSLFITEVRVNGEIVSVMDYTYKNGVLNLPSNKDGLIIPASEYSREAFGKVTASPGRVRVEITGKEWEA